jgi:hypothetical protein
MRLIAWAVSFKNKTGNFLPGMLAYKKPDKGVTSTTCFPSAGFIRQC